MDDVSLLVLPTLVVFAAGLAFVLRQVVNTGGEPYQYKEYRLDDEGEKQDRKRRDGGQTGGPTSPN